MKLWAWLKAAFHSIGPAPVDVGRADVTVTLKSGETLEYELVGSAVVSAGRVYKRTAQTLYKLWPSTRMAGPLFRTTRDQWIPATDIASIKAKFSPHMQVPE